MMKAKASATSKAGTEVVGHPTNVLLNVIKQDNDTMTEKGIAIIDPLRRRHSPGPQKKKKMASESTRDRLIPQSCPVSPAVHRKSRMRCQSQSPQLQDRRKNYQSKNRKYSNTALDLGGICNPIYMCPHKDGSQESDVNPYRIVGESPLRGSRSRGGSQERTIADLNLSVEKPGPAPVTRESMATPTPAHRVDSGVSAAYRIGLSECYNPPSDSLMKQVADSKQGLCVSRSRLSQEMCSEDRSEADKMAFSEENELTRRAGCSSPSLYTALDRIQTKTPTRDSGTASAEGSPAMKKKGLSTTVLARCRQTLGQLFSKIPSGFGGQRDSVISPLLPSTSNTLELEMEAEHSGNPAQEENRQPQQPEHLLKEHADHEVNSNESAKTYDVPQLGTLIPSLAPTTSSAENGEQSLSFVESYSSSSTASASVPAAQTSSTFGDNESDDDEDDVINSAHDFTKMAAVDDGSVELSSSGYGEPFMAVSDFQSNSDDGEEEEEGGYHFDSISADRTRERLGGAAYSPLYSRRILLGMTQETRGRSASPIARHSGTRQTNNCATDRDTPSVSERERACIENGDVAENREVENVPNMEGEVTWSGNEETFADDDEELTNSYFYDEDFHDGALVGQWDGELGAEIQQDEFPLSLSAADSTSDGLPMRANREGNNEEVDDEEFGSGECMADNIGEVHLQLQGDCTHGTQLSGYSQLTAASDMDSIFRPMSDDEDGGEATSEQQCVDQSDRSDELVGSAADSYSSSTRYTSFEEECMAAAATVAQINAEGSSTARRNYTLAFANGGDDVFSAVNSCQRSTNGIGDEDEQETVSDPFAGTQSWQNLKQDFVTWGQIRTNLRESLDAKSKSVPDESRLQEKAKESGICVMRKNRRFRKTTVQVDQGSDESTNPQTKRHSLTLFEIYKRMHAYSSLYNSATSSVAVSVTTSVREPTEVKPEQIKTVIPSEKKSTVKCDSEKAPETGTKTISLLTPDLSFLRKGLQQLDKAPWWAELFGGPPSLSSAPSAKNTSPDVTSTTDKMVKARQHTSLLSCCKTCSRNGKEMDRYIMVFPPSESNSACSVHCNGQRAAMLERLSRECCGKSRGYCEAGTSVEGGSGVALMSPGSSGIGTGSSGATPKERQSWNHVQEFIMRNKQAGKAGGLTETVSKMSFSSGISDQQLAEAVTAVETAEDLCSAVNKTESIDKDIGVGESGILLKVWKMAQALESVICLGMKTHKTTVVALGTIKTRITVWDLVEESASTLGSPTGHFAQACQEVKHLSIDDMSLKFCLFICSLLNRGCLDFWLQALQHDEAISERFYEDEAPMRLCVRSRRSSTRWDRRFLSEFARAFAPLSYTTFAWDLPAVVRAFCASPTPRKTCGTDATKTADGLTLV